MRVLATFPEVFEPPAVGVAGTTVVAEPPSQRDPGPLLPAAPVTPRSRGPRPIRIAPRPRFPTRSIAVLALVSAAVWSLVAARERAEPVHPGPEALLAAEPIGSADAGVTR